MKPSLRTGMLICCVGLVCTLLVWLGYRRKAHSQVILRAANVCLLRAESGDIDAELELSRMYFDGTGVPRDPAQALLWARKAADQGSANAASAIGSWYYHGVGVPQNYGEAFRWYSVSARRGDAAGEYGLGYMYLHGLGVKQDDQEAIKWIRKSAELGYARAQCELGFLYRKGYGISQDYAQAAFWYRKAADQGDSEAESGIGFMEFYGYGVAEDRREANSWFHKAAEQGDAYARRALGIVWLGMTPLQLIFFIIQIVGGTLLLISFFVSKQHGAQDSSDVTPWAGGLCLLSAGIWWYENNHYAPRLFSGSLGALTLGKFMLDALIIILLVQVLRGHRRVTNS